MHLKGNNIVTPEARSFLKSLKREEELDESTFIMWKTELQKDLPTFWESMNETHKRF